MGRSARAERWAVEESREGRLRRVADVLEHLAVAQDAIIERKLAIQPPDVLQTSTVSTVHLRWERSETSSTELVRNRSGPNRLTGYVLARRLRRRHQWASRLMSTP